MTIAPQTSAEIQTQIAQLESEVKDINKSMTRLSRSQDLLDAMQEVQNRASVIGMLSGRLDEAREREAKQAEQDKKRALEKDRDDAKTEHDRLSGEFESIMGPLEAHIASELAKLDEIAFKRWDLNAKHADACFLLRGRVGDFSGKDQLSLNFGWTAKDSTDPDSVRRALYPLYATPHKMPGNFGDIDEGLMMKGRFDANYRAALYGTRPQELTQPDNSITEALDFLDDRMNR